jgi:hypothetical protein
MYYYIVDVSSKKGKIKGKNMKIKGLSVVLTLMIFAVTLTIPVLAGPTPITIDFNQAQDQWRGVSAFGAWTPGYSYLASAVSEDFVLKGKTLHTSWSYSPVVVDLTGESTVYVYDKELEIWIEREGTVSYIYEPGYGTFPAVNYFRGYLDFDGEVPSTANFVGGVAYQWCYLFAPETAILEGSYTANAVWDETMGAWLVGFSVYRWTPIPPASYLDWPDPFPTPVSANIYDPLGMP